MISEVFEITAHSTEIDPEYVHRPTFPVIKDNVGIISRTAVCARRNAISRIFMLIHPKFTCTLFLSIIRDALHTVVADHKCHPTLPYKQ